MNLKSCGLISISFNHPFNKPQLKSQLTGEGVLNNKYSNLHYMSKYDLSNQLVVSLTSTTTIYYICGKRNERKRDWKLKWRDWSTWWSIRWRLVRKGATEDGSKTEIKQRFHHACVLFCNYLRYMKQTSKLRSIMRKKLKFWNSRMKMIIYAQCVPC